MKKNIKLLSLAIIFCTNIFAATINKSEAENAVKGWLNYSRNPLSAHLDKSLKNVCSYSNETGQLLYYVVNFENEGFVIVSPDDLIEPIIAFSGTGFLDPNPQNPLFDFLNADLSERILSIKDSIKFSTHEKLAATSNKTKWENLFSAANNSKTSIPIVDDPRVDPIVETKWSQSTANGNSCYNYYTPRYVGSTVNWDAGNSANYVCGCVATALAQFLRQREFPTNGIGTGSDTVDVLEKDSSGNIINSSYNISRNFRGGDDSGGAYLWNEMPFAPSVSSTTAQRQNIGRLTYDCGVSVNMYYSNRGSGTDTLRCKNALVNVFNYANAIKGYRSAGELVGNGLYEMVNPNLDAGIPTLLGITGPSGGHAIVCDGYGYNLSTLYHHLNMGWAGSSDAWYDLPNIGTGYNFNKVYKCVYNIFETGTGEIISGRIVDAFGAPLSNVIVSADGISTFTDGRGIYALVHVTSGLQPVSAAKLGYVFSSTNAMVGTSTDYSTVGNAWEVNFVGIVPEPILFINCYLLFMIFYLKARKLIF